MSWSPQQEVSIKGVNGWIKQPDGKQIYRLFGYAGTGKTTLARELAKDVSGEVLFASFTGKAAMVLQKKGCPNAATLHSLMYKPDESKAKVNGEPVFKINEASPIWGASLLVVDEVSMVDDELGKDLVSFGKPILVLGDPAQLPPVKGGGYFTNVQPDSMLTEIHRQAADNPIIEMATLIRSGGALVNGIYGNSKVISPDELDREDVTGADQVLVGRNLTRVRYNNRLRKLRGLPAGLVQDGDKLVCLKNDKELGLLNGGLWTVQRVIRRLPIYTELVVKSDDFADRAPVTVEVRNEFFVGNDEGLDWKQKRGYQEFTFGYALTVHKSQGSQWDNVCLFDESDTFKGEWRRWLYTGVTRAAEKITVVG